MAYEVISDPSLYVNAEALARFGITLSDDLAARAIKASNPLPCGNMFSERFPHPISHI